MSGSARWRPPPFDEVHEYTKSELVNFDICLEAVKYNGVILRKVPKEFKGYELCFEAVKNDGLSLKFVPEELKDYNMCLTAVKNDGDSLKFVPIEFRDNEMCVAAVQNDGMALQYVPEKNQSEELCLKALNVNYYSYKYIIDRTYQINLAAVKLDSRLISEIENPSREMILEALNSELNFASYAQIDPTNKIFIDLIRKEFDKSKIIEEQNKYLSEELGKIKKEYELMKQTFELHPDFGAVEELSKNFSLLAESQKSE